MCLNRIKGLCYEIVLQLLFQPDVAWDFRVWDDMDEYEDTFLP